MSPSGVRTQLGQVVAQDATGEGAWWRWEFGEVEEDVAAVAPGGV